MIEYEHILSFIGRAKFSFDWGRGGFLGWRVWESDCLVFKEVLGRLENRLFWEVLRGLGNLAMGGLFFGVFGNGLGTA